MTTNSWNHVRAYLGAVLHNTEEFYDGIDGTWQWALEESINNAQPMPPPGTYRRAARVRAALNRANRQALANLRQSLGIASVPTRFPLGQVPRNTREAVGMIVKKVNDWNQQHAYTCEYLTEPRRRGREIEAFVTYNSVGHLTLLRDAPQTLRQEIWNRIQESA